MFIELHKPGTITINVNMIQYLAPTASGIGTVISVPNCNGSIVVEESYEQVKELIEKCLKK